MAELSKVKFFGKNGVVTATVLDTVGPDRMALHLIKASHAARMTAESDETEPLKREIKDLLVSPFSSSGS